MKFKKDKFIFVVLVLCLFNIIFRLPFANHPANYDEVNYFSGVEAIVKNNLSPFTEFWGYKPPVIFEPVAMLFKLLFPSMIWGRLYIYLFSSLSLLFLYLLGKKSFDNEVGVGATLILFFFPMFITQSLLYQDAVPLTALLLSTLYFYFSKKKICYMLSATLLVLTKEPAIFCLVFIFMYDFLIQLKLHKFNLSYFYYNLPYFFIPLLLFVQWMILNKYFFGWFLWPYNKNLFLKNSLDLYFNGLKIKQMLLELIYTQMLWLFLLIIVMCILLSVFRKSFFTFRKEFVLFMGLFIFYCVFYYSTALLYRYILFVYPLVFLIVAYYAKKISAVFYKYLITLLCLTFVSINLFNYFNLPISQMGDNDLRLIKTIKYYKQLTSYIETNFHKYPIITTWPLSSYLYNPLFNYVKQSIRVTSLDCHNIETIKTPPNQVFIDSNMNCLTYIKPDNSVLIKNFKFDMNHSADIYLVY